MIQIQHLHKYFNKRKPNEIHVINDISLEFPNKGLVVLLGASGSGKTTLLNVVGGLDKVNSGTITILDETLKGYHPAVWDELRTKNIGYVFQNYYLLKDLSVYDNVAFVLQMIGITNPQEIEKRVHYILKAVNMFSYRKRKASQLSGGQQQRVAIARALVKNPHIIIADEPTGNLDSSNTLEVMNILKVIAQEKLVILVTHERNIAEFYADRIIELKDGQVVEDKLVDAQTNHQFSNDNVIYLKDLEKLYQTKNGNITTTVLADQGSDVENLNVTLILKNKTWYLNIESNIQKVKLLSENAGVKVVNEHFKEKTREEITNTTFGLENLAHDQILKRPRSNISWKKTLQLAFLKIAHTTRRGKLMFFAFILSGILMAFASSYFFNAFDVNPYDILTLPENYVSLNSKEDVFVSYSDLASNFATDEAFFVHSFPSRSLPFYLPSNNKSLELYGWNSYVEYGLSSPFDTVDHVKESSLVFGRLPENNYEMVIDQLTAEQLLESSSKYYGVWKQEQLLLESIRVRYSSVGNSYFTLKIVGIVNTNVDVIYLTTPMLTTLSRENSYTFKDNGYFNMNINQAFALELLQDENAPFALNLVSGSLPQANTNQFLLPQSWFLQNVMPDSMPTFPFSFSVVEDEYDMVVTGTYDDEGNYLNAIIGHSSAIVELKYNLNAMEGDYFRLSVYASNPKEAATTISSLNENLTAVWSYDEAVELANEQVAANVGIILTSVLVLVALNALGFYFIIRSSMMNRIYEISVYRALGVKRKDIVKLFFTEILFLLSITSLLGYAFGTGVAYYIANLFENMQIPFSLFLVSPTSIFIGLAVMYGINLLFGLLPVFLLMLKTPSEILSKYDI